MVNCSILCILLIQRIIKNRAKDIRKFRELNNLSASTDISELVEFYNENAELRKSEIVTLCPTTQEFRLRYNENREKGLLENAGEVSTIYRNGLNPVIPGSSLKGAIRTAVLKNRHRNGYDEPNSDPFRAVGIGDCEFSGKGTQLVGLLKNFDKTGKSKEKMQIQAEVLKGYLMNSSANGTSRICINGYLSNEQPISIDEIISSCNDFFLETFRNEYNTFYRRSWDSKLNLITSLKNELENIVNAKNQFIVRLGRWSQREFVTVSGKQSTTRTVFDYDGEYLPLGWCKCTVEKQK